MIPLFAGDPPPGFFPPGLGSLFPQATERHINGCGTCLGGGGLKQEPQAISSGCLQCSVQRPPGMHVHFSFTAPEIWVSPSLMIWSDLV